MKAAIESIFDPGNIEQHCDHRSSSHSFHCNALFSQLMVFFFVEEIDIFMRRIHATSLFCAFNKAFVLHPV